jgi:hypothetical protein
LVAKVKEKTMANKKFWLGMLVMILALGMMIVGCGDDTTENDVTVTFDANGGKWDDGSITKSARVRYNTHWSEVNVYVHNPTRQDYTFWEWTGYPNPDPNTVYIGNIIRDCTLYARWE